MSVQRRRQSEKPDSVAKEDAQAEERAAEDIVLPAVSSTVMKLIIVLVLLIINLVAFLYAGSDLDTLDPQRYYSALGLPPGVKRIRAEDISAAYDQRSEDYQRQLRELQCAESPSSTECDALKAEFEHLKKAYEVLGDSESRIDYDRGYQNYFRLLGVTRNATLEELSTAHTRVSKDTTEQFDNLNCPQLLNPRYLPSTDAPIEQADVHAERIEHLRTVNQCRELKQRQSDLAEAWRVLGHETSRQVYQFPQRQVETLSFISSPIKAAQGVSWMSFVFPALTVLAVVFVVTQVDLKNMVQRQ